MAVQWRQRHRLADPAIGRRDSERRTRHYRRGAVAVRLTVMLAAQHRVEPSRLASAASSRPSRYAGPTARPSPRWTWKLKEMPNLIMVFCQANAFARGMTSLRILRMRAQSAIASLARHELDGELGVSRVAQRFDALLDLALRPVNDVADHLA